MLYNLSNISAANSTLGILQKIDTDLTGGVLSLLIVFSIFFILFITFSKQMDAQGALLGTAFLSTIVIGLFYLAGFASFLAFLYCLIILVIAMGIKIII